MQPNKEITLVRIIRVFQIPEKKFFSEIQMLLLVRIPLAIYDVAYFYVKIHSRQDKR